MHILGCTTLVPGKKASARKNSCIRVAESRTVLCHPAGRICTTAQVIAQAWNKSNLEIIAKF